MKINRILIFGYGNIAKKHSKILKGLIPNVKIKFYRNSKKTSKTNNLFLYEKNQITNYSPDLAIIANPSSLHLKTSKYFIKNNIPVFIEKPVSDKYKKCLDFLKLCKDNQSKVFVGYNLIFSEGFKIIKKNIDKNFGKIFLVKSEVGYNLKYWRKNINYKNSVSAIKNMGGGVLLELSHEMNYLQNLFGQIIKVDAFYNKLSDYNINVEDYADMRIFFKKSKNAKKLFANLSIDFLRNVKTRNLKIYGNRKTIIWDLVQGKIYTHNINNKKLKLIYNNIDDIDDSYINMWKQILINLNKKNNYTSLISAIQTLKIIDKIKGNK